MKSHIFMSIGLLISAIFLWRTIDALKDPGFGFRELYIVGGFIAAGLLIRQRLRERKQFKKAFDL